MPDNLKTGVDRPDLYDPRINRAYAELAAHYGVLRRPRAGVQAQGQGPGRTGDAVCAGLVLAGPGVHQPGADAGRGGDLVPARSRTSASHRSLDGASPVSVFDAVEAPALKPLPRNEFVLATWSTGQGRPGLPRQGRARPCTRCRGG